MVELVAHGKRPSILEFGLGVRIPVNTYMQYTSWWCLLSSCGHMPGKSARAAWESKNNKMKKRKNEKTKTCKKKKDEVRHIPENPRHDRGGGGRRQHWEDGAAHKSSRFFFYHKGDEGISIFRLFRHIIPAFCSSTQRISSVDWPTTTLKTKKNICIWWHLRGRRIKTTQKHERPMHWTPRHQLSAKQNQKRTKAKYCTSKNKYLVVLT